MVRSLRVPVEEGECARSRLREKNLLSRDYYPATSDGYVLLPLLQCDGDTLDTWRVCVGALIECTRGKAFA